MGSRNGRRVRRHSVDHMPTWHPVYGSNGMTDKGLDEQQNAQGARRWPFGRILAHRAGPCWAGTVAGDGSDPAETRFGTRTARVLGRVLREFRRPAVGGARFGYGSGIGGAQGTRGVRVVHVVRFEVFVSHSFTVLDQMPSPASGPGRSPRR